jgi:hypothetical protein
MSGKEKAALFLSAPPAALAVMFFELPKQWSGALPLCMYGLFLASYLYYVLFCEYAYFPAVHLRKSPALDWLIVGFIFASIRLFNLCADPTDLRHAIWWLDFFLASLCSWEIYTMCRCGYFTTEGRFWLPWCKLLREPLFPFQSPSETSHRDEYRYWLLLDGTLFVVISLTLFLFPTLPIIHPEIVMWTVTVAGTAIGLINIFRYRVVLRRTRRLEGEDTPLLNSAIRIWRHHR